MESKITKEDVKRYEGLIDDFSEAMLTELINNHHKGGRETWLTCGTKEILGEIYYHTGKLQSALREGDLALIKEYCADIANLALITSDIAENEQQ